MAPMKRDGPPNRNIRDFFKPFTIPKSRIPVYEDEEDEIVVATSTPKNEPSPDQPQQSVLNGEEDDEPFPSSQASESSVLSSALSILTAKERTPKASQASPSKLPARPGPQQNGHASNARNLPSSQQRRVMTAVEIPALPTSQQKQLHSSSSDLPTAPPKLPIPHTTAAATSFSSISTLSSVPMSTQSSSRRVLKNGIQAVTNSDSDSVESSGSSRGDEESSSGDDLVDISAFIPRKKARLEEADVKQRQSARLSGDNKTVGSVRTPGKGGVPLPEKKVVYKYGLAAMVKQRQREEEAAARMREAETQFEESQRMRERERDEEDDTAVDLQAVVANEGDDGGRMMRAMQRTETADDEQAFYYIRDARSDTPPDTKFPSHAFGDAHTFMAQKLQDEGWRTQACLTGFLSEVAARGELPDAARDWFASRLLHEKRGDLREAYACILESCKISGTGKDSTLPTRLSDYYVLSKNAVESVKAPRNPASTASSSLDALDSVLRVVRHFGSQCGDEAIASSILEFVYARIDARVAGDTALKCAIEDAIEYLLQRVSSHDDMFTKLKQAFHHSGYSTQLKCNAIASLPALSEHSHALQRRLAISLVTSQQTVAAPNTSPANATAILHALRNAPQFHISDATNYSFLNPLLTILDLALDAGFYEQDYRTPAPSSPPKTILKPSISTSATASETPAETAFNAQIDAFITQLTLMASRIKDAGTTHLRRSEAKHALERLVRRLEFAVRSRPRKRGGVFGAGLEVQRGLLRGFLAKAGEGGGRGVGRVVRFEDGDGDGDEKVVLEEERGEA